MSKMWRIVFHVCLCVSAVISQSCRGRRELQGETGVIVSHQSIGKTNYQNNLDCTWSIRGGRGKVVRLQFEVFSLEADVFCRDDSLTVYDGGERGIELRKLCGYELPEKDIYSSSGKNLTLKFKTDSEVANKGFKVRYKLLDADVSVKIYPKKDYYAIGRGPYNPRFECRVNNVTGGASKLAWTFKPNSPKDAPEQPLPENARILQRSGVTSIGFLSVVNPTIDNYGYYICREPGGHEARGQLIVMDKISQWKPHSIAIFPDEVVAGQKVECSVQGNLLPLVSIYAFGKSEHGRSHVALVVPKTVEGQQEVDCLAVNLVGRFPKAKNITVNRRPHSISISPDEVVVGQRVYCSAEGYPEPQVRIEVFDETVNGTSAVSLVVPTTVEGQQEVKCIATNSVGTKKKTKLITVNKNRVSNAADVISMQRIRRLQIEALEMQKNSVEMQMKSLKMQIKSLEMQIKARKTVIAAYENKLIPWK